MLLCAGCIMLLQSSKTLYAQKCFVKITGEPIVHSILKAFTSDSALESLTWLLNNKTVYVAHNTGFRPKATTVAGTKSRGLGSKQLYGPDDVAVDAAGNIYVLDSYNNRVQKWSVGASYGVTVAGGNG